MPAEHGDIGNKVKRLCIYALLCAVCMAVGYLERLIDLSFIVPGIKPGLSNAVACVLVLYGDKKGAFAVNISRILLSALLFGSPVSLCFSLAGGILSLTAMALCSKSVKLSAVGVSIIGGVVHNVAQCAVGLLFVGFGVVYYLPVLLISGVLCGAAVGVLSSLILKRIKKGEKYV